MCIAENFTRPVGRVFRPLHSTQRIIYSPWRAVKWNSTPLHCLVLFAIYISCLLRDPWLLFTKTAHAQWRISLSVLLLPQTVAKYHNYTFLTEIAHKKYDKIQYSNLWHTRLTFLVVWKLAHRSVTFHYRADDVISFAFCCTLYTAYRKLESQLTQCKWFRNENKNTKKKLTKYQGHTSCTI
jgi:hypothetical protein